MLAAVVALVTGMLCLLAGPGLAPGQAVAAAGAPALRSKRTPLRLAGWFCAGYAWAWLHAAAALAGTLPAALDGEVIRVEGVVASMPVAGPHRTRFLLDVERCHSLQRDWPFRGRLRVDDYTGTVRPDAGDRWRLALQARWPRGQSNPGGFDIEGWLLRNGIAGTARVIAVPSNARLSARAAHPLQSLRQALRAGVRAALPASRERDLVIALLLGERAGLQEAERAVLRRTGTAHLLAISGLHVGLVAAAAYLLVGRALTLRPPWRGSPPRIAALAALAAAIAYAALAGWSLPTRRAVVMVAVVTLLRLRGVRCGWPDLLAVTLAALAICDPLSLLAPGLWLSLAAVLFIAATDSGRLRRRPLAWRALRVHCVLAFAMAPLIALLFGEVSLIAPLANLVAVPALGALLPLILAGGALLGFGAEPAAALLGPAAFGLDVLWRYLEWLADLPLASAPVVAGQASVLAAGAVAAALALAPAGLGLRPLAAAWVAAALLLPAPRPPRGEFALHVIDVGQGLSVLVETASHALLYDTGPSFRSGGDMAGKVVLPLLRTRRLGRLDLLVVSHSDDDHAGGTETLLAGYPIARVMAGPEAARPGARICRRGLRWRWDDVQFRILHPGAGDGPPLSANDRSCVLAISGRGARALIAGDVEAAAEARLVERHGAGLAAEVLVAPHHGSRTSSTPAFLAAAAPRFVIVSAGARNRYGLPHPQVLARYRALPAQVSLTAADGMVSFASADGDGPRGHRSRHRRFWHRR